MKDNKYYTSKQEEKIYKASTLDNEEIINESIICFFKELMTRKPHNQSESDLQASAIILENSYAVKINELNGLGSHMIAHINLTRNLMNQSDYIDEEKLKDFSIINDDLRTITSKTITLRIICTNDELVIVIHSKQNHNSNFSLNIIEQFANCLEQIHHFRYFKNIEFYINIPNIYLEIAKWNSKRYETIKETIESEKNSLTL